MRKSTVIARCLLNSNMMNSLEEAERAVRVIFDEEFPGRNFDDWNQNLNDITADNRRELGSSLELQAAAGMTLAPTSIRT